MLKRPKEYMLLLGLAALIAAFFLTPFFSQLSFFGAGSDIGFLNYPMRSYFRQCLSQLSWPLWNPYLSLGMPAQTGARPIYSPLVLATLWLPTAIHLKVSIWLHITLSIGLTACMLRSWGHSRSAGLCAGMVFAYSGFAAGHLYAGHLDWLEVQPFYPLLTWTSLNALRRPGPGWWALMTITLALTVLSGHYQSIYLIIFSLTVLHGILALLGSAHQVPATNWNALWDRNESARPGVEPGDLLAAGVPLGERLRDLGRAFLTWLWAGALALALCSFQLMPAAESLLSSNRLSNSAVFTSQQPGAIIWLTTFIPGFFDGNRMLVFWSYWPSPEAIMYFGVPTLVLIPLACWWSPRRQWLPLLFVFSLAAAITPGPYSPLYQLLTAIDPIFMGNFRSASRFAQICTFFAGWLAALGVDRLRPNRIWVGLVFPGIPLLILAIWLGQFRSHLQDWSDFVYSLCDESNWEILADPDREDYRMFLVRAVDGLWWTVQLLLAFILLTFLPVRWRGLWTVLILAVDLRTMGLPYLRMDQEEKVTLLPPEVQLTLRREAGVQRTAFDPDLHWLNRGMSQGVFEIGGYDSMANPALERALSLAEGQPEFVARTILEPWVDHPIWSLLGVSLIVSANGKGPPWPYLVAVDSKKGIYRNPRALPRAYMVATTRWQPDRFKALEQIMQGEKSSSLAYVNSPSPAPSSQVPILYSITNCQVYPNQVVVGVNNDQPGMLVLSDAWWPGWHVKINDRESTTYCLNGGLQRGAWLPAGQHQVIFYYWPRLLTIGIAVSLTTLATMLSLLFWLKARETAGVNPPSL